MRNEKPNIFDDFNCGYLSFHVRKYQQQISRCILESQAHLFLRTKYLIYIQNFFRFIAPHLARSHCNYGAVPPAPGSRVRTLRQFLLYVHLTSKVRQTLAYVFLVDIFCTMFFSSEPRSRPPWTVNEPGLSLSGVSNPLLTNVLTLASSRGKCYGTNKTNPN